jgi:hypothetical protein
MGTSPACLVQAARHDRNVAGLDEEESTCHEASRMRGHPLVDVTFTDPERGEAYMRVAPRSVTDLGGWCPDSARILYFRVSTRRGSLPTGVRVAARHPDAPCARSRLRPAHVGMENLSASIRSSVAVE